MKTTLNPPLQAPAEPVTETLHGVAVTDPYRWLEDQRSPRTRKWLEEQAAYTRAYFEAVPHRDLIQKRVTEILSISSATEAWNVGDRYFLLKRLQGKEQPAIVMRNAPFGEDKVILDPAPREGGASIAVAIEAISQDGRFLAYSVRKGGTDHAALEILDIERNTILLDRLPEGFCTSLFFASDGSGFYYSHRELYDRRPNYQAAFWHRFGTERSDDHELFFAGDKPNLFLKILHSPEANLLAYAVFSAGKHRSTSTYLQTESVRAVPELLLRDVEGCFVPFFVSGNLLAYTDFAAPNFRVVRIDMASPDPANWRDVVPESDRRIQHFASAGDQIIVSRVDRFSTSIEAFSLDGKRKKSVAFSGTADLPDRPSATDKLFYRCSNISEPSALYCHCTRSDEVFVLDQPDLPFDPSIIASEEDVYSSKDGISVPLLLAARKDLIHSGPLPTFITGYGGFGICVTPRFSAFATFLMEQGFLFAVPAIRGGSELGEYWHLAGNRERRQKSFDDFVAVAEWLLSQGHSAPGRIAIGGGSNAGLLVGAVITQRPDLFRAAICLGPLLDMTRYHLYDFAATAADEYGSPEDEHDFRSLLAYSPYHRVQNGVNYPAVLLISGDADTRCNPMHARKMTARLQSATRSGHPILLDYKPSWGHMPVQPLSSKIQALTDRLAFLFHELGVDVLPRRPS